MKKGLTTTLPLAPGRIGQQRYKFDADASFTELARQYFRWIGAAAISEFQWFSGLGVKAARLATEPLKLAPLQGHRGAVAWNAFVKKSRAPRIAALRKAAVA